MALLKYLAKDYLAEALQQRRSQNERMMVPLPHHIELVEDYVHRRGPSVGKPYKTPWLNTSIKEDYPKSSVTSITKDLNKLVENSTVQHLKDESTDHRLEQFEVTLSENDGGMEDVLSLSQDITLAIERYVESPMQTVYSVEETGEKFMPPKLFHGELVIDEGYNSALLEDLESPLYLEGLQQLIPTVDDLVSCLQSKMVQDPFLDEHGNPFSYNKICKTDFCYDEVPDRDEDVKSHNAEGGNIECVLAGTYHETFLCEGRPSEPEVLAELVVDDNFPLEPLSREVVPAICVQSLMQESPCDANVSGGQVETSRDLEALVDDCKTISEFNAGVEASPVFSSLDSPAESLLPGNTEESTEGISHVSSDSGLGLLLLESPCIPPPTSPLTLTPAFLQNLHHLHSTPLSADSVIQILSPGAVKTHMKEFWEHEKMFDAILALTITCPSGSHGIEELKVNFLSDTAGELSLEPEKFCGDDVLELCWDPLEAFYGAMEAETKSIVCYEPKFSPSDIVTSQKPVPSSPCWPEMFSSDTLEGPEDGMISPVALLDVSEEGGVATGAAVCDDIPELQLNSEVPRGYCTRQGVVSTTIQTTDAWGVIRQASATTAINETKKTNLPTLQLSPMMVAEETVTIRTKSDNLDGLDAFMMLRSGRTSGLRSGRKRARSPDESSRKCDIAHGMEEDFELEIKEVITAPAFKDICLSGAYLNILGQIESLAHSFKTQLQEHDIEVPVDKKWPRQPCLETLKFLFKQLQKEVEDSSMNTFAEALANCQRAACLYLTCFVMDVLMHCSMRTALDCLSNWSEKYSELVEKRIHPLKDLMMDLESKDSLPPHPKLTELVRIISTWMKTKRKSSKDKVVIIIPREFLILSGEVLDYVQSIPGLTSCVFSIQCDGHANKLYKNAIRERFHHYDCLVVPIEAVTDHTNFQWEKVSLLVEYEEHKYPLFDPVESSTSNNNPSLPTDQLKPLDHLNLQSYFTLRTVLDLATSNLPSSNGRTYTVVASHNVTGNSQLLQLLETRYSVLVIERDYSLLPSSKYFSWADIIVSHSTSILFKPLSTLGTESGGRGLISTVTLLSLQYQTCWIILYQESQKYELGGNVPHQLSLLHAAVAPLKKDYRVNILTSFSITQSANLIRKILEQADGNFKKDRDWISEEFTEGEKFLIAFPCIHSFNAQFMLQQFTIAELLNAEISLLFEAFPSIPGKVIEMFYSMVNSGSPMVPSADYSPSIPTPVEAASYTPPVSYTYDKDVKDCIIYRTDTVPDEVYDLNDAVSLAPAPTNHYSAETAPGTCAYPGAVYSQTANIPGLDDSLEDLVPENIAESDNNNGYSLFHEDLISWLHPVENDHKNSQESVHLNFQGSWSSRNETSVCKQSDWYEHAQLESSFPSSFESNSGLIQQEPYSHAHGNNSKVSGGINIREFNPTMNSVAELQQNCSPFSFPDKLLDKNSLSGENSFSYGDSLQQCARQNSQFYSKPLDGENELYSNSEIRFSEPIINLSKEHSVINKRSDCAPDSHDSCSIPMASSEISLTGLCTNSKMSNLEQFTVSDELTCSSSLLSHHQLPRASSPSSAQLFATLPKMSRQRTCFTSSEVEGLTSHNVLKTVPSAIPGKHLVPRSSKVIASSTVRKPPNLSMLNRKPVKALDLGLVEERSNWSTRLQSSDRTIVPSQIAESQGLIVSGNVNPKSTMGQRSDIIKSKYFISPAASSLGQEGFISELERQH